MKMDPIVLSIPIFFLLIGLELIWDWRERRKKGKGHYRLNDAITNISCGIIDQVTGVFAKVFTVGAYALAFHFGQNLHGFQMPSNWGTWIACFVTADLAYYWAHRFSHQINLLWTGHVVHHSSEEYNLSVALRQGAFQKLLTFWVYLPVALIGFPPEWFVLSMAINLLYQFWIHTESVDKMGFLEKILNTPSHHRVHHGRNPKYIDRNHAGVLIIWDKLFGTFQEEEERPTYGITVPVNTFNPVEVHVKPFQLLWQDVKSIPGFGDKMRYLFNPPGWYPATLGGFKAPPALTGQERKFDVAIPMAFHWYVLSQYVVALILTSLFLFNLPLLGNMGKAIFTAYILFYIFSLGNIFNGLHSSRALEWMRVFAGFATAWWMGLWLAPWAMWFLGTVSLVSLVVLIRLPFDKLTQ